MQANTKPVVVFDPLSGKIFANKNEVGKLNYSERLVFELLVSQKNKILTKDQLLAAGWPDRVVVPNSLNIAMRNIRSALERAGVHNEPETIPKMGYRLSADVWLCDSESNIHPDKNIDTVADFSELDAQPTGPASELDTAADKSLAQMKHAIRMEQLLPGGIGCWHDLKRVIYRYLYILYLFTISVLSIWLYGAKILAEPTVTCVKHEGVEFCGAHAIEKSDIPPHLYTPKDAKSYWFSERDDEYLFFKAD